MDSPVPPVAHQPPTGTADTFRATGAQPLVHTRILKIVNDVEPGACRRPFPLRLRPTEWCK